MAGIDPEIAVAAVATKIQDSEMDNARSRATKLSTDRDAALTRAQEALKEAEEDKSDGGFFGGISDKLKTVAQVATVVAAGAAVMTGVGAPAGALLLVGLGLSGAGMGMKMAHADVDLGTVKLFGASIDVKLSDVCELAGAGCSAAGAVSAGASAAQASSTASRAAEGVRVAANLGGGGALVGSAYYTVKAAKANGAAADREGDAQMDNAKADDLKSGFEGQVDALRGAMQTRARIADTIGSILQQHRQQNTALTEGLRA